jgi:hypothetical protein
MKRITILDLVACDGSGTEPGITGTPELSALKVFFQGLVFDCGCWFFMIKVVLATI